LSLKGFMNPKILAHPNIPKPLHGISPRVVFGQVWWDIERRKAYAAAFYCCEACGIPKQDAKYHQWLEAHEYYAFDYDRGRLKLLKLVALCHSCHCFIHDGRMRMMVSSGDMTEEMYDAIIEHGSAILTDAGLLSEWLNRHRKRCDVAWADWRMEINGKLYGPSSMSQADWERGAWKKWKPEQ
jgi:hypothetical protein